MPRFSDVFVFDSSTFLNNEHTLLVFSNCYLLKNLGDQRQGHKVEKILFDVAGMYLMFEDRDGEVTGPFCLTTL